MPTPMPRGPLPLRGLPASACIIACALLSWCGLAAAQGRQAWVGAGPNGLPSVDRVGFLVPATHHLVGGGNLGYGYTESMLDAGDSHHRLQSVGGLAYHAMPVSFGGRLEMRYDAHQGGPDAGTHGAVMAAELSARPALSLTPDLAAGFDLTLRVPPGKGSGGGLAAVGFDLQGLLTWAPEDNKLSVAGSAGLRIDRSSEGIDASTLTPSERVSLGASDSHALLLGVAAAYREGPFRLLGELGWDLQVGADAPAAGESPMRVSIGGRYFTTDWIHLGVRLGVSPSGRTEPSSSALSPVEPRFTAVFEIAGYSLSTAPPTAREPAPPEPTPEPTPAPATIRGAVLASGGGPLPDVTVQVPERDATATTDPAGAFSLPNLAPGRLTLSIEQDGFQPLSRPLLLEAGKDQQVTLTLEAKLPEGQVRGSVRSWSGEPLLAQVEVLPIGKTVQTDAEGRFEIEVAPGTYTVRASAPGHSQQERQAVVEQDGVTVILIDLKGTR